MDINEIIIRHYALGVAGWQTIQFQSLTAERALLNDE